MLSIPWVHSVLGTFNSKEQIDEALSVLEEAPFYSEAELQKVQTCLKERIRGTSLKERIDTGKVAPYIPQGRGGRSDGGLSFKHLNIHIAL